MAAVRATYSSTIPYPVNTFVTKQYQKGGQNPPIFGVHIDKVTGCPYTSGMDPLPRRVLVVDDDGDIRQLIVDMLSADGYAVQACASGEQALAALQHAGFELMLADIKMPGISGIDLLQHVRSHALDTEVILMTAYASIQTAIEALRGEAFDYIIKPFSLKQFRERVQQAMKAWSARVRRRALQCHLELCIDMNARRVWKDGDEISLTRREFDVLAHLWRRQGLAVSRQELLEKVWGCDEGECDVDTVKSCVCRMRKKIGDDARRPRHILSVRGVGFVFGD